jgi:hypothetical protein
MSAALRDELLRAIRALPARERLRLVEDVIHELRSEDDVGSPTEPPSVVGLFADEADLFEQVADDAMQARERDPLRRPDA